MSARRRWLPALVLLAASLAGCSGPTRGTWTFLVYMVADNNLEPFGVDDLHEMAQVGSSDQVRLVAQVDRAAGYSALPVANLSDWHSTRRMLVRNGSLDVVEELGERNLGLPGELSEFLRWGIRNYPADNHALILWDHGGSWPGFGGDESTPTSDLLTLPELRQGLAEGLSGTGVERLRLIGFDACLMATYEVAQAVQPYGDFLLASEELEPGHGWDYRSLAALEVDPTLSPTALAQELIDGFQAQAVANDTEANITLSLVDLQNLGDLQQGVAQLADSYGLSLTGVMGRERLRSLEFGRAPQASLSTHMVDLGDLSAKLAVANGTVFAGSRAQISLGLTNAVLLKTAGPVTADASGLSIYFPLTGDYYDTAYDTLPGMAPWRAFLAAYHGADPSAFHPRFTNLDGQADVVFNSAGLRTQGTLQAGSDANIALATLTYGLRDEPNGRNILLGDQPASYDTTYAWSDWDLSFLYLTQGTTDGYGYLSLEEAGEGVLQASILFAYYADPNADATYVVRKLVFDADGNVTQDTYFLLEPSGLFGELNPVAGSELYPLLMVRDDAGQVTWALGSDFGFDPAAAIDMDVVHADTGDVVFTSLQLQNFASLGDEVSAIVTMP